MRQSDLLHNLKDAYLAGYWEAHPDGKIEVWRFTEEQKAHARKVEDAAYEWARGRLGLLMKDAQLW